MQDWIVPAVAGVLALAALVLALAQARTRRRTERELTQARAETSELRERIADLERRLTRPEPRPQQTEFVITDLGRSTAEAEPAAAPPQVGSALFADLVLRETVVKAASLAYGVRRALEPEVRNRVWFEMKREVRRSRKQRKVDTREARREWAARRRAEDSAA